MKQLFEFVRSISQQALSFVDWWFRELASLFPSLNFLRDGRTVAFVRLGPECSEIIFRDRYGKEVDRFSAGKNLRDALGGESALLRERLAGSSIEISLAPSAVCLLEWQHPGGRRPTRDSVRYRLLQESPIDTTAMEFDWRTKAAQAKSSEPPLVEVALCRKSALTDVLCQAQPLGFTPALIGFACPRSASLDWIFAKPARSVAFSLGEHKKKLLLLGLIVWPLLAMVAVGVIATLEVRSIRLALEEEHKSLRASERLLHRQAELSAAYGVLRQVTTASSFANAIDELGGLLPPEAWFTELRIEGRSMRIVGFGADPTSAVKALSRGRHLHDIRLGSVSSPNPSVPTPQFELTAALSDHP